MFMEEHGKQNKLIVVLDLDEDNNAEVVFTKELIQSKEDFEDCDV